MTDSKNRFLVVDDDESLTLVLTRALTRRGYLVEVAHDVKQAISLSENQAFDRAIVDLKMEGPSGLNLIPELKTRLPEIEIVILTGYSSIATTVEAIKLGAINYLCKPANTDEILAAFEQTAGNADINLVENPLSVDRLEWEHIQKVLNENEGNISATARALGMHRRTLQRKLQKKPVKR